MKERVQILVGILILCFVTQQAQAQENRPEGRNWRQVAEGVWQKRADDGALLTAARGPAGMKWAEGEIERELVHVAEHYRREPTAENFENLAKYLDALAEMRKAPAAAAAQPCSSYVSYDADADAGPLGSGAWASASAGYSIVHNYYEYCSGNVYSRAEASLTSGGVTTTNSQVCSLSGNIVTCNAYASIQGSGACSSNSFSYASYPPWGYYTSRSASQTGCDPF